MYPPKNFPLQQGDLDSLCMVYAILNALNRAGRLDSAVDAELLLHEIVGEIRRQKGDLVAAITEGFDPIQEGGVHSDVNWAANIIAPNLIGPPTSLANADFLLIISSSRFGCIVYFEDASDEDKTHYTFVLKSDRLDVFDLWDSYGFKTLRWDGVQALVDEHPVKLKYAWETLYNG